MAAESLDRKDGTHRCCTCKQYLTAEHFYKSSNVSRYRGRVYGLYERCKECCRTSSRRLMKNRWPQYRYGITLEDIARMTKEQDGRCAICSETMKRVYVDHDHANGDVRGLLCCGCNSGLGQLGDSIEGLQRAMNYLKRHLEREAIIFERSQP